MNQVIPAPAAKVNWQDRFFVFLPRMGSIGGWLLAVVVMSLGIVGSARGQTNTWDGSSSSNWNTAANWSLNQVPTAAHDVVIPNNFDVTVNTAAVCASFTIDGGGDDNTISISGTNSLTVSGAVTINGGTATGGGANDDKIVAVGAGTLICASITIANTSADGDDSEVTISTGTVTVTGNITMNGSTARNAIRFSNAGTLNVGGSISGGTIVASTGTVNYNGSSAQSVAGYAYFNLTLSGAGAKTLGGDRTITGNLLIESGATLTLDGNDLTINVSADRTATINGTLNINGNGRLQENSGGTKTLILGPSGYLDITDNGGTGLPALNAFDFSATSTVEFGSTDGQPVSNTPSYGNLVLSGTGTKTFGGSTTILGTLSINITAVAGLPNGSTSTATTLKFDGTTQVNGLWGSTAATMVDYQNDTYFLSSTSGVINIGSGSQTFTSSTTFTVPEGVTSITVQAWGGGGGGGGGSGAEAGGGGGAYATRVIAVMGGQTFPVTVGLGGTEGNGGGSSQFGTIDPALVIAVGGSSGSGNTGFAGGLASACTPTVGAFSGGSGGNAAPSQGGGDNEGGGGGGGSAFTNADGNPGEPGTSSDDAGGAGGTGTGSGGNGAAADSNPSAQSGTTPGGGGGGTGEDGGTAGSGANGQVIISWETTACPSISATISGTAIICTGGSTNLTVSITGGTSPYDVVYTDGTNNFTVTGYASNDNISVSPSATTTYTLVSVTDDDGCTASMLTGSAVVTVVAQPTGPTLATQNPANATICTGTTVSATFTAGSGGTGCTDDYILIIDGGAPVAYTPGSSVGGSATSSIVIQGRRANCDAGAGCTGTSYVPLASWAVVAQPTGPTLATQNPANATICTGTTVSATFTAGSGGSGCADDYILIIDGGAPVAYTPGSSVGGSATTSIVIQGRRANCDAGAGCTGTSYVPLASWAVVADPIAPIIAKSPNLAAVCAGTTLTISVTTPGSGGTGTCTDEYRHSTDNGSSWSNWSTSLPSFAAVTGTNLVESRRNCDGAGCDPNVNQVSWTVNPLPTAGTCNPVPDACYNNMGSIDVQASGGTPPYTVTWSPMDGSLSPALTMSGDTGTISGLQAGQAYTITVTDSNGCQALSN